MKIWILSGWIHLTIGFLIGWIVFKRPQWATNILAKIRAKLGW